MARLLYDLAAAEPERRFSPYCWRTKMALLHKHLPFDTTPWRFTDKEVIAFSGQKRVPVLVDGDHVVFDSWTIATYLEDSYPDRPSLFGGDGGRAAARFVNAWADGVLVAGIARLIAADIFANIDANDRAYFRKSREERFGMSLEKLAADRETKVVDFRKNLDPLRAVLAVQTYLGGANPAYVDYIVFGCFQWARCISRFPLLLENDPIGAWRDRLLSAFDGFAGAAPAYPA
ncbi:MAG: glutathione S-transferase family protein [Xanthobacteraceae bacterium]